MFSGAAFSSPEGYSTTRAALLGPNGKTSREVRQKMFVEFDPEIPPGRDHPWTVAEANPESRYCDFKAHPEQIPSVLEDFKPWSHYPAITRFYDLLTWVNGSASIFESNDCGLCPPKRDDAAPDIIRATFDSDPIVVHGRLTIIFRDLNWNAFPPSIAALKKNLQRCLQASVGNIPAVVKMESGNTISPPSTKKDAPSTFAFGHGETMRSWR